MKVSIAFERSSHVDSGASVEVAELSWPATERSDASSAALFRENQAEPERNQEKRPGVCLNQRPKWMEFAPIQKRLDNLSKK